MNAKVLMIAMLSLVMSGCTVTRPLADEPSTWESLLKRGDRIVIHDVAGQAHDVRFHAIADGVLYGEQAGETPSEYAVEMRDIDAVEIRKFSAGRTVSNVVVGTLTVAGVILWAGMQSGAAGM